MNRIRFRFGLVLGIVASMVLGAALASVAARASVTPAPTEISVPNGRIGDVVSYAWFERFSESAPLEPGPKPETFVVLRANATFDQELRLHDAVSVVWTSHPHEGKGPFRVGMRDFVELRSRLVVRHDQPHLANPTRMDARYGPAFPFGTLGSSPALLFQARDYRMGETLGPAFEQSMKNEYSSTVAVSSFRAWVASSGKIDERTAFELRSEGILTSFDAAGNPDPEVAYRRSVWVSEDSPYPLLIRETWTLPDGSLDWEWLRVLTGYRPGDAPIPWIPGAATPPRLVVADRPVPGARYPPDGTGLRFCYPLSQALTDAVIHPGITAWRAAFSQNYLVGAQGSCGDGLAYWRLNFAAPSGEVYSGAVSRIGGQVAVWASSSEDGVWRMKPFNPAHLPENLAALTFGERALQVWAETMGTTGDESRVSLSWGIRACCLLSLGTVVSDRELRWARIDQMRHLSVSGYAGPIEVDLAAAHLSWSIESGPITVPLLPPFKVLKEVPPVPLSDSPPNQNAPLGFAAAVPSVEALVLASSTLVALFLLAYFYPALKSLGAHGLLLIPGYAKLRRDELLNNQYREELVQAIRADPGISPPELQRIVGCGWSTVVYHLKTLERNGLVNSLIDGRHKRCFPADAIDWSARGRVAVLRNPTTKRIFDAIRGDPGIAQSRLWRHLSLRQSSIRWHLERLETSHLIQRSREGRSVRYGPAPGGSGPGGIPRGDPLS